METHRTAITPVLTVSNAAEAIAFYHRAFGADEIYRNAYPDGKIVVEMAIEGARFRVADEAPESSNLSPKTLGGTTVRINLLSKTPMGSPSAPLRMAQPRSRPLPISRTGSAKGASQTHTATTGSLAAHCLGLGIGRSNTGTD